MHKLDSSRERVSPGRLNPATFLLWIAFLFLASVALLPAQSPTPQVALSATPASANQTCTITATVANGSTPVTAGNVTFTNLETVLGTAPVNSSGTATLNVALPAGFYRFFGYYSGSSQMGPAVSSEYSFIVTGSGNLTLASSGASPAYNLTATLTTNVQGPDRNLVTFIDNTTGQTLGTAPIEQTSDQGAAVTIPSDSNGNFYQVGDFNGDGRMDTVTTNFTTSFQVQANLTHADGSTTVVDSNPFPNSQDGFSIIARGDFNGDGITDLVVQDDQTDAIWVLLGSTSGQLTAAGQAQAPIAAATVVGDFNNDGHLDLIAGVSGQLEFFAGDGAGNLAAGQPINAPPNGATAVADYTAPYNEGGNLDLFSYDSGTELFSYSGTTLYLGAGNGTTFTAQPTTIFGSYLPPPTTTSLVTGDFNGDGIPDIAYATGESSSDTITILYGDGTGNFHPAPNNPNSDPPIQTVYNIGAHYNVQLAVADVNADGYNDIVAFVQDEAPSQAQGNPIPWKMIVLTGNGGGFTQSAEANPDSTGVNFPNPPVPFTYPIAGEALDSQLTYSATIPFLSECCTQETLTARLNNVNLPAGSSSHNVSATLPTDGYRPTLTSNSVQLSGGSGGGAGGGSGSGSGPTIATLAAPNGSATISNGVLQLTDGGTYEAGSAFSAQPVDVQSFVTTFTFQLTNAQADGFTFTVQNNSPQALGAFGGELGYGAMPGHPGIPNSVALKFDLFNNAGEGNNSTGVYPNGANPNTPATDMTPSGVDLHSGDVMQAQIIYDGADLHLTLTDTTTNAVFQHTFAVNIPQTIGSTTAYVGFTGGTGALAATQQILSWSYTPLPFYPNFSATPAMLYNGGATINGSSLLMIAATIQNQANSAWFPNPVPISQFTTDFTFAGSNADADGITFTIQNAGPSAVGPQGGGLGYGALYPGGPVGITNSMAIKFDLYNNDGEGNDSTGIFTNGDSPTVPAIDLSSTGINLHSTDQFAVHLVYDGSTITMTLLDLWTNVSWSHYFYGVNLPQLVGGPTAYVGFTGGTGTLSATEQINAWTYLPSSTIYDWVKIYFGEP